MLLPSLVQIGIATRTLTSNPWYDRLMSSLESKSAGIVADILVEAAPELTKVEKRIRLLRRSTAQYLCILEDDAEILHDGWLLQMVAHLSAVPNAALMNPQETRLDAAAADLGVIKDEVQEITNVAGFCVLINRASGVEPDVRVQTLDDLWMSLVARSRGYRCVRSCGVLVRHSKQPWAEDEKAPWEQEDRSRWGEGHDYYRQERHEAKRRIEARLMVEAFGDLARITLPKELLSWADPLHPDFGMAWDRGQPISSATHTQSFPELEGLKVGGTD